MMNQLMDYQALGERIRERRKQCQLSQAQLARCADASTSFIGHVERGTRKASIETLVRMAAVLMTTPDALLIDTIQRQAVRRPNNVLDIISRRLEEGSDADRSAAL